MPAQHCQDHAAEQQTQSETKHKERGRQPVSRANEEATTHELTAGVDFSISPSKLSFEAKRLLFGTSATEHAAHVVSYYDNMRRLLDADSEVSTTSGVSDAESTPGPGDDESPAFDPAAPREVCAVSTQCFRNETRSRVVALPQLLSEFR